MNIDLRLVIGVFAATAAYMWPRVAAPQGQVDPDTIWKTVHGHCVPHQETDHKPGPCEFVDLNGGTAVLRDIKGVAQSLLVPTRPSKGIEDSAIWQSGVENYFADAWDAVSYVHDTLASRSIPEPGDGIGLAINSKHGRTQRQLHIHIDCLRAGLVARLNLNASITSDGWVRLKEPLRGHYYAATWLPGADLRSRNPLRVLADRVHARGEKMEDQTLVVVPAQSNAGASGFFILGDQYNSSVDSASGEELLDHCCGASSDSASKWDCPSSPRTALE